MEESKSRRSENPSVKAESHVTSDTEDHKSNKYESNQLQKSLSRKLAKVEEEKNGLDDYKDHDR